MLTAPNKVLLCSTETFSDRRGKGFDVDGVKIFIVTLGGNYYAYINRCPHQNVPLDWDNDQFLDCDGELVQCASHGAQFVIESGVCVAGPCTGQRLTKLELSIVNGDIFVHWPQ